jgi:hypothetical protein
MNSYWFSNSNIGLVSAFFFNIEVPLEPFDSGLDYEAQPCKTVFRLDFIRFGVSNWRELDGRVFQLAQDDSDASTYIGYAHNRVYITSIKFKFLGDKSFNIDCTLFCNFEAAGVGQNATVEISTIIEYHSDD